MNIALVYPPTGEINLKGYPLGLAYLSAALKGEHEIDIYNYNGKEYRKSIKHFLRAIKSQNPDLVGISFNSFNRGGAYHLLKNIKKINRNIIVVLGGVHPSVLHKQIFQYFYNEVDFIIQSEGERSFYSLCYALENGGDYKKISGLVYKDKDTGFIANPVSDIVMNLDDLPVPDFSYAMPEIRDKGLAYLITSRGCPVNCSFCSTSSFWGQRVRMNSPERVGAEIEYVKRLGAKRIFFHDDTFNLSIERTIKLTNILKQMSVEYVVQCRVKPVNEEMIKCLAESGCRHISWGVESLSDKMLEMINKKISKQDVKNAFELCAPYTDKMTTSAYCCVGVPGESEDTVSETVEYMDNFIRSTHGPGASILYILPGTKIYQDLVNSGKFNEKIWIRSDAVYYYTQEHNIRTLNKWRKRINRSGIRLPYTVKYFWDLIPISGDKDNAIKKSCKKFIKKVKRYLNLVRNRY
jgi:radical SAM superfamily enzyme YgiQ (UPF0313 family)